LNGYKSAGTDQIPAELIKIGSDTLCSEIHKLISSVWNIEELPQQWKEFIIISIHKKGDKTDCNIYRGISLLSTAYNILSNILLARLTPYVNEVIGYHQCGFRRNRATTDHATDTGEKCKYNAALHRLFTHFKKAYDSVKNVLHNILL
jgi:hypothetical protein